MRTEVRNAAARLLLAAEQNELLEALKQSKLADHVADLYYKLKDAGWRNMGSFLNTGRELEAWIKQPSTAAVLQQTLVSLKKHLASFAQDPQLAEQVKNINASLATVLNIYDRPTL